MFIDFGFILSCVYLQLNSITVESATHSDAPAKTKDECCPGQPYILYHTVTGVPVEFVNPVNTGMFDETIDIVNGDNVSRIVKQISKRNKLIKG